MDVPVLLSLQSLEETTKTNGMLLRTGASTSTGSTRQGAGRHCHIVFLVVLSVLSIFGGTRRITASQSLWVDLVAGLVGNGKGEDTNNIINDDSNDDDIDSLHDTHSNHHHHDDPPKSDHDDWWLYQIPNLEQRNLTHPHLGARHPINGSLGMVVDPSVQRLRPPILTSSMVQVHVPGEDSTSHVTANSSTTTNSTADPLSFLCPSETMPYGIEGEGANQVMHKIRQGLQHARKMLQSTTMNMTADAIHNATNNTKGMLGPPVRILCMIYTVHAPSRDNHSLQATIADTWGRDCDGFFGASNMTDHTIGTIDLVHEGPEEYSNMWQKIRTMWTYAYDHYLADYDYFFIAGDDTYVLMDHMRFFLQGPRVRSFQQGSIDRITGHYIRHAYNTTVHLRPRPLIFGTPMMVKNIPVFSGGGGYVLNQAALELWGTKGADTFLPDLVDSKEDILMAKFFFLHHVYMSDTQDENGCWRFDFNAYQLSIYNGKNTWINPRTLQKLFGFPNPTRLAGASSYHISFHMKYGKFRLVPMNLTQSHMMWRYHAFFNDWCPSDKAKS